MPLKDPSKSFSGSRRDPKSGVKTGKFPAVREHGRHSVGGIPTMKTMVGNDHGSFDEFTSPYKTRVKRVPIRDYPDCRTSGPVGPELDFSIRNRDLEKAPVCALLGLPTKGYKGTPQGVPSFLSQWEDVRKQNTRLFAEFRPKPGCFRTFDMSDIQVLQWTEFAMRHGIEYKNSRSYSFPKKIWEKVDLDSHVNKTFFLEKKDAGIVKHRRSASSRKRRSEARRFRSRMKFHP